MDRRWALTSLLLLTACQKDRAPQAQAIKPALPKPTAKIAKAPARPDDPSRLPDDVLERVKQATVLVGNFEGGKLDSTGSGVVLSDGRTVLTNRHVVVGDDKSPDDLKLVFFAGTPRARIVRVDRESITLASDEIDDDDSDIAAIRIKSIVAKPLSLADPKEAKETLATWSTGFPNGMNLRKDDAEVPSPTVHALRVERIERKNGEPCVLQFGGSVTYGDSGGPVVTRDGRVLGIIQALADRRSSIVYALPISLGEDVIAQAKQSGAGGSIASRFAADLDSPSSSPSPEIKKPPTRERRSVEPSTPTYMGESTLARIDVSDELMSVMSPRELTLLRNEPFARWGYIFKRRDLRTAFGNMSWYRPITGDLASIQKRLSNRERRNIELVIAHQRSYGKGY